MSNLMSQVNLKNHVSRNGFDLSFRNAFTAKVGELLPVCVKECLPGDKFKINTSWFTRTQPVQSAAYSRFREYVDVFFVPNRLLWRQFDNFIIQTGQMSSAKSITESSYPFVNSHPYFTMKDIRDYFSALSSCKDKPKGKNLFGFERWSLSAKLMSYLGYGDFPLYGVVDDNQWNDILLSFQLNPNPLLAYQKIYQDWFRDSMWEKAAPNTYNVDYLGITGSSLVVPVSSLTSSLRSQSDASVYVPNMFDLQYCNWNKDYFTGVLPKPQFGLESVATPLVGAGSVLISDFDASGNTPSYLEFTGSYQETSSTGVKVDVPISNEIGLSVLALRKSEAAQRWAEITQSGRADYQSQIDKHWNVKVSDDRSDRCRRLGGSGSNLDITEVVNNNITSDHPADIAGKGVGGSSNFIEFDCKEHGVLMAIYHCVPLLDYVRTGVDKFNMKNKATDYAIPEFDSIGMQPVNLTELSSLGFDVMFGSPNVDPSIDRDDPSQFLSSLNLGYVPRYAEYKTSVDEVHGAFTGSLKYWVSPMTGEYINQYFQRIFGSLSVKGIGYGFQKVNPSLCDSIFGVAADSFVDSDQLLVNVDFDIKAVRNLDFNGLPY